MYSDIYEVELEHQMFFPVPCDAHLGGRNNDSNSQTGYRFSNISLYSSAIIDQAKYTTDLISNYFDPDNLSKVTITDATSCIGGNTWSFASVFGKVNAVEIHPVHFELLQHNMNELGLNEKIHYYNQNYLSIYPSIKQDVIYLDPPWGGLTYKSCPKVGLYMNPRASEEFVDIPSLLEDPEFGSGSVLIVLKVPKNYSTYRLEKKGFEYKRVYSLKTQSNETLYKIVIFSRINSIRKIPCPIFKRLGYKSMIWKRKETSEKLNIV